MTVRDALAAIGRRWYVVVAVMLAFGALTLVLSDRGGSFYSKTTVSFTLPNRTTLLPDSGNTDTSVIAFASAVATAINQGKPVPTYSSADAPYFGAGVRQGSMVSLRNDGNQWMASFPSATIDIQVVGPTREWVSARQALLLNEVVQVARAQQFAVVAPASRQITATIQPLSTQIAAVPATRSTQIMAVSAMTLAGLLVACPAAVAADGLILGRRRRRAASHTPARTAETIGRPSPRGGYV
jgi:hypothetical protein